MEAITYTNRYKDEFTFTPDSDGNLLWEGEFKWCRYGMPNDYSKAYESYCNDRLDGDKFDLDEFKTELHEHFHDEDHPFRKYVMLIVPMEDKIDMVDPSGGPYITTGMGVGIFHPDMKGKMIVDFEQIETGYKLILKDKNE
jgi:hypothetical protein